MEEKLLAAIRQGLTDELSAAVNYTRSAAKQQDMVLQKQFLNYAMEEMSHAQKLLGLLESMEQSAGRLNLTMFHESDLLVDLLEYLAHEESAIFYYDILENLHEDDSVKMLCRQIRQEEQRHLKNITDIIDGIKSGAYHCD